MLQTILIGLIAFLCYTEPVLGYSQYNRPIVTGALVGLALGDLETGLLVGASLELAFMGTITIGGALPPDVFTGGILGAAFAITTGSGVEGALALALPIATLALLVKNVLFIFARGAVTHKADKYAELGDDKGVARMHIVSNLVYSIPMAILVALSFHYGGSAVQQILDIIPDFIMRGLTVASGILPALGFAMLAKMILNKKVAPYFFLGFGLSAYLNIPLLGIACFAVIIAVLVVNSSSLNFASDGGVDDDF